VHVPGALWVAQSKIQLDVVAKPPRRARQDQGSLSLPIHSSGYELVLFIRRMPRVSLLLLGVGGVALLDCVHARRRLSSVYELVLFIRWMPRVLLLLLGVGGVALPDHVHARHRLLPSVAFGVGVGRGRDTLVVARGVRGELLFQRNLGEEAWKQHWGAISWGRGAGNQAQDEKF
jgi:hypothetical protein